MGRRTPKAMDFPPNWGPFCPQNPSFSPRNGRIRPHIGGMPPPNPPFGPKIGRFHPKIGAFGPKLGNGERKLKLLPQMGRSDPKKGAPFAPNWGLLPPNGRFSPQSGGPKSPKKRRFYPKIGTPPPLISSHFPFGGRKEELRATPGGWGAAPPSINQYRPV